MNRIGGRTLAFVLTMLMCWLLPEIVKWIMQGLSALFGAL